MVQLHMQVASLWPWPLRKSLKAIKEANFDGIEVILRRSVNIRRVVELAREYKLKVTWHEIWSLEDDPSHWFVHVMALVGMITRKSRPLAEQLPFMTTQPVICYAHRMDEIDRVSRKKLWIQTCRHKPFPVDYHALVERARTEGFRIVFDTQHVLEWKCGVWGVEYLAHMSKKALNALLIEAWQELGPYTDEIHLNNFCPKDGHTWGRNIFPTDRRGVLDLNAFAKETKRTEWDGIVTLELKPSSLFFLPILRSPFGVPLAPRLNELEYSVRMMFK